MPGSSLSDMKIVFHFALTLTNVILAIHRYSTRTSKQPIDDSNSEPGYDRICHWNSDQIKNKTYMLSQRDKAKFRNKGCSNIRIMLSMQQTTTAPTSDYVICVFDFCIENKQVFSSWGSIYFQISDNALKWG